MPSKPDQDATQEDDGALLGMVFDAETQTSSLVVRCLIRLRALHACPPCRS